MKAEGREPITKRQTTSGINKIGLKQGSLCELSTFKNYLAYLLSIILARKPLHTHSLAITIPLPGETCLAGNLALIDNKRVIIRRYWNNCNTIAVAVLLTTSNPIHATFFIACNAVCLRQSCYFPARKA